MNVFQSWLAVLRINGTGPGSQNAVCMIQALLVTPLAKTGAQSQWRRVPYACHLTWEASVY